MSVVLSTVRTVSGPCYVLPKNREKSLTSVGIEPTTFGLDHRCSTDRAARPDGSRPWEFEDKWKGERKGTTTTKQNTSNSSYLVEVTPQILSLNTKPFVIFTDALFKVDAYF